MLTGRAFVRWDRLRERREGGAATRWLLALVWGLALAGLVGWRGTLGVVSASHMWLAGTIAAFALAFMRAPFQIYWRRDAALLAQLPIDGLILFDSAIRRCVRAAVATLVGSLVGGIPLALLDGRAVGAATRTLQAMPIAGDPVPRFTPLHLYGEHVLLAVVLGVVAACAIPAISIWAASLVAHSKNLLQVATALGGAPVRARPDAPLRPPGVGSAGAVLGALPGFAASIVIVIVLLVSPALVNREPPIDETEGLAVLIGVSLFLVTAMRQRAAAQMGAILRDVSALDRQRLATLEIHPPTRIERGVARLIGDAALPYRKDARLMRRRYPMAYALGALAFIMLAIIAAVQPTEPAWLYGTLAGAVLYAVALARRLAQPPIDLARLSSTLPISATARRHAKVAWLVAWLAVFLAVPTTLALVR